MGIISRQRCFTETRQLIHNPIDVLQQHTQALGPTFTYYFGGAQRVLVSSDPAIVQHVLKDNHINYHKSPIQTRHMVNYLGRGLLSDECETWRPKRKRMQKGFQLNQMEAQATLMQEALETALPRFDKICLVGETNLAPQICEFVFGMTARALFGISMSSSEIQQISQTVSTVQAFMVKQVFQPYLNPWFYLSGQTRQHQALRKRGDAILLGHIKNRLKQASNTPESFEADNLLDILYSMMTSDQVDPMSMEQILAEAMQFLVAGHETSSNTLGWVITLLDQHPEYQHVMLEEFDRVVGQRPVNFSDLRQLSQTQAILDEAMRLYPPFWMLDRIALEDDNFDGNQIRRGDSVMCFLYGMHRSSQLWEDPDCFKPERFLKTAKTSAKNLIHIPFGTGPRRCIGEQLARLQMVMILQTLYQRYEIKLTNPKIELEPRFTLSRKHGLVANVRHL